MYYVGIDWADENHQVFITDDSAQRLGAFSIKNSRSGVEELLERIRYFVKDQKQALFALETSKGLLIDSILDAGYTIYPINPKSVDRYRDTKFQATKATISMLWCWLISFVLIDIITDPFYRIAPSPVNLKFLLESAAH